MENYTKTETNELNEPLHSIELDNNAIHMNVKLGSKVNNLMTYANKHFQDDNVKQITWNGSGDALNKVVACAEIMKSKFKNLYQINKIGYSKSEEIWNSKLENLRDIKVTKEIPKMCIILSKTPLDPNEPGYQTRNTVDELFNTNKKSKSNNKSKKSNNEYNKKAQNFNGDDGIYVKKKKTLTNN